MHDELDSPQYTLLDSHQDGLNVTLNMGGNVHVLSYCALRNTSAHKCID